MDRDRFWNRLPVTLLALCLLAAACTDDGAISPSAATELTFPTTTSSTAPATTTSSSTTTTEPPPPSIDWLPCGAIEGTVESTIECASFDVPLDHDSPDGDTLELRLARVPASDQENRIGSVFVNFGGPGAGATVWLSGGFRLPPESSRRFDLIGWDPRGVGASDPVACATGFVAYLGLDQAPDSPEEQLALDQSAAAIAAECAEKEPDRLAHLSTNDVVRDLDLLRAAVGDEQLTFLGLSYGSLIGQRYAEQFPDRVRALALDGILDPDDDLVTWLTGQSVAFEAAVQRMLEACPDQSVCGPAAYDELAAAIEITPLDTEAGPIGPSELAQAALETVYLRSRWPVFHQGLADGYTSGDGTVLRDLLAGYLRFDFAAYLAVECVDLARPADGVAWAEFAAGVSTIAPRTGAVVANELLPCAYWPVPPQAPVTPVGSTEAPILLIATTGDPATPYEDAVAVAERLPTATLLTREGEGHTALAVDRCVEDAVDVFLTELTPPPADLVC